MGEPPLSKTEGIAAEKEKDSTAVACVTGFSDSVSEGCSSEDSGQGCSETTATTPSDSLNETETDAMGPSSSVYNSFTAYSKSVGSVMPGHAMSYEFEIPQSIVGRLIGRHGSFVKKLKDSTRADIIVKRHYMTNSMKICAVEGSCREIDEAIKVIRDRFPLKKFPYLTLEQVNRHNPYSLTTMTPSLSSISFLPSNNKLNLIEGVTNDVSVIYVDSLSNFFVQQPTHPTYPALSRLHQALKGLYEQPVAPHLLRPFNIGVICVTRLNEDDWYRAEVVAVNEEKDQVTARLVDVGGYVTVPIDDLRQIRVDFVTIPFQATECRLANVVPVEGSTWCDEALEHFKSLTNGHVLQAHVVGYSAKDGVTLIHLYKLNGNQTHTWINDDLVKQGYAKKIEQPEEFSLSEDGNFFSNEIEGLCEEFAEWVEIAQ